MSEQAGLREIITTSTPAQLVDVLNVLSEQDVRTIVDHLKPDDVPEVLRAVDASVVAAILDKIDVTDVANLLRRLHPRSFPLLLEHADPRQLTLLIEHISTPHQLKRVLDLSQGDDAVVERFLEKAGEALILDRVFALMPTRLLLDQLGDDNAVVEWRVRSARGVRVYHLTVSAYGAQTAPGVAGDPRAVITLSAPDMLRLACGLLDGITAFLTGRIELEGDLLFGAKLSVAFDFGTA